MEANITMLSKISKKATQTNNVNMEIRNQLK